METNIHIIDTIYTFHNFELNRFIDNNEKLILERRNIFYPYRRIIIHYKDIREKKTPTHIFEGWCFSFQRGDKKVILSIGKKETFRIERFNFELLYLFYYIEKLNLFTPLEKKENRISYQRKESSDTLKLIIIHWEIDLNYRGS